MVPFVDEYFNPAAAIMLKITLFIAISWTFFIGQIVWVIFITARYISKLPHRLKFKIQASHPDNCGGLKPIGDFCFDAALFLIGAGLALAVIAILDVDITDTLRYISTIMIFIVIGPLTAVAVFVPLWNIHELMVQQKKLYLDKYGVQVKELEKVIFDHTKELGQLNKAIEAKEKLEILAVMHPEKVKYPVWPFKFTSTVLFMFSPQLLKTLVEVVTTVYDWLPIS
jgi:hypothetical protein